MTDFNGVARRPHERLAQERRIKSVNEWRDVSQTEVAEALGYALNYWNRWEKGRVQVPEEIIRKAAAYYGVRAAYLAWGELPRLAGGGEIPAPRPEPVSTSKPRAATGPKKSARRHRG